MFIGVDARNLTRPLSGIARVIVKTISVLHDRGHGFCLFLPGNLHSDYEHLRALPNVDVIETSNRNFIGRQIWGATTLVKEVDRAKPDIFWAPAHRLSHRIAKRVPSLLTIHDIVWIEAGSTMKLYRRLGESLLSPPAMRNAKVIHTISDTTRMHLAERFPWTRSKSETVYNIVEWTLPEKAGPAFYDVLSGNYVLFVGTLEPRKNLEKLIEAFVHAFPAEADNAPKLVLAGQHGWHTQQLDQLLKRHKDRVIVTGRIDDAALASLYRDCRFVAIVSVYEGFGFPVLEAQMFGKCVLVTANSSLTEIGGSSVVAVRTDCPEAIASGLKQAWQKSQEPSIYAEAQANARAYAADQLAEKLEKIFERTMRQ